MAKREIRPVRVDGQVAYVPLTQGYTAIIDAADVHLVEGLNWCARTSTSGTVYAMRTDHDGGKQRTLYLHRVIMGDPIGLDIDHRDANALDNRRTNLRAATKSQNMHNQRIRADNTSGYKGVRWLPTERRWGARIAVNGVRHSLGLFRCSTSAAVAYAKASRELHGEFGRVA